MNGNGATGFDDDGQQVPVVGFDLDAVEQAVDGQDHAGHGKNLIERIREAPDAELVPMLTEALDKARVEGREQGRMAVNREARLAIYKVLFDGDPTPLHAGRRLYRMAYWDGALPGCDTQEKLAQKLDCTRSAIGQQLAKEIPSFERETGARKGQ